MKIIRPMDLTADGVVGSNAPPDEYAQWSPIGRDFLTAVGDPLIAVGADSAVVIEEASGSSSGSVNGNLVTLSTGAILKDFIDTGINRIFYHAISPDGAYYAVQGQTPARTYKIEIFSCATGQKEYETESQPSSRLAWAPDSSMLATILPDDQLNYGTTRYSCLALIAVGTWATSYSSRFTSIFGNASSYAAMWWGEPVFSIDSASVFMVLYSDTRIVNDGDIEHRIAKFSAASLTVTTANLPQTYRPLPAGAIGYNPERGEVLAVTYDYDQPELSVFDAATLSAKTLTPTISADSVASISFAAAGDEVVIGSLVSHKFRRFVASTYVESATIDSVVSFSITDAQYSDNYYVLAVETGGYALIDRTDDTLITQTNPTVTAGDIYTYGNHNYEALTDNNDSPDLGAVADPPTWLDLGFINPLRMFDNKLDSRTTAPSPLVIDITPGMLVNGLALFNVDAATVQITYTDPTDGLVYDTGQISMLDNSGVQDWYSFFFDPYLAKSDLASVDLPAYIDGTVQITLDGAGAGVAIGEVVLGTIYQIGEAQYGSSAGIIDFSRKEADQFGNFEIVPRRFSKRAEFDAVIPPAYGGSVQRTLARLRATPIVWIGSVDLEETIVYGYFREFDILLSNPAFSNVTITVEGL